MTLLWNNRSQFSWTSISEGCSLKVKCSAHEHGRGVWEQQLLSGLRFLKVQPFSSQVNWSWGQEGSWEEQLMKTKMVNAEEVRKGHCWTTLTIQDTNDRRINWKLFFSSRTLSFNWDDAKGPLAPLHSVMLKIYPTMTSTFPTFSFLFSNNQTLLLP